MQVFVRVAEAGSFIAVAHQLDVDRSVVTRQIGALEKSLGIKLINRSTRRLSLSTAGAAFLEQCRVILQMVESAETGLRQERAELRGRIRLALPLMYGVSRLMPVLIRFAEQHPHIDLSLDFSDRRTNLIEEGIDLAVRISARLGPGDVARRLGSCKLLTLAAPEYLRRRGTPRHPSDLLQHDCLGYAGESQAGTWHYRRRGEPISVSLQCRLSANNGDALMQMAAQGLGITLQPDFIAERYLQSGQVVSVLRGFQPEPLGIHAVLPSNRFIPHRIAALIDFIAESITATG